MATKYQVIWHEENDAGVPKYVMGSSELFDTELEAKQWIDSTVEEDKTRHADACIESDEVTDITEDDIRFTRANDQHCWYATVKVDVPDDRERADRAEALVDTLNRLAELGSRDEMRKRIADYYREVQTKGYLVDLRCCPSLCVRVEARSAEEAERIVSEQVDSRTLFLSKEQKDGLVNDILENVDEIEAQEGG